ncbi:MAG: hypothetical protein JSS81_03780 [Acidobacteria bacterium]|nr:hypothetical protein [Acidobacteriota bacterium]
MKKKSLPKTGKSDKIRREKDPIPWRYCILTLVCGVFLVGGFFLAARAHFSSIDFGIKNSGLKKQIDDLESEKRRLLLLKEIALSPAELKKAAKKLGLTEITASSFETVRSDDAKPDASPNAKNADDKPKPAVAEKNANDRPAEKNGKDGSSKDKPRAAQKDDRTAPPVKIAKK